MKKVKSKLGNPEAALIAAKEIEKSEASKQVASTIPVLIKYTFIGIGGIILYRFVSTRFKKKAEVSNFPASNITLGQAKSKATAIYKAIGFISNDFEAIKNQFAGVNYNGIVRIYNAFGQVGNMITGYSDMDTYLNSKLSDDDLRQLRFLTSGNYFKTQPPQIKTEPIQPIAINDNPLTKKQFSGV